MIRNSLVLADIEQIEIHGGSLRLFVSKTGQPSAAVKLILEQERDEGFNTISGYQTFARQVNSLKSQLVDLLTGLTEKGSKIAAYGASAKGSTLLNFCGLATDVFDFVVDRSTAKQGLYMPGVKLQFMILYT